MRKIILLVLISLSIKAMAQSEPANYATAVSKFTTFYNTNQPDSIYKMFGVQMTSALSFDNFKTTTTQLRNQFGNLTQTNFTSMESQAAVYKATFQNGALALSIVLNKQNQIIGLLLKPLPAPAVVTNVDPSLDESPFSVKTLSCNIHGTLTMPKNASGKIPVVLIIAGSGPTDRDGNGPKQMPDSLRLNCNTYKDIAEALGKNGIASVRYDKRMVGESVTSNKESDLRFDDYVDDAVAIIKTLNQDERFSKIIVLGHSEGSLVGMIACRDEPVKAFISIAGAGEQADKVVTEQMKSKPQYMQDEFKTLLDSMRKGKTIDDIDPRMYFIARPSIQHYLMSWFRYPPNKVLKTLRIPILIIQGTTDLQVSVADAEKLKKARSEATLLIIPNMNHVLKDAPADRDKNLATYNNPDLPLKAELMPGIISFINEVK